MVKIPFSQVTFQQASRPTQLLLAGSATLAVTATILYASRNAIAKASVGPKPTFGSFGFRTLTLERVDQISHDTKRFRFALPGGKDSVSGLKLTSSLLSMSWPKGEWTPVLRPYTPVSDLNDPGHLDFIIKHYPKGRQSSHVHSLKPGDSLTFFGLALPGYNWSPNKHSHVLLIAGGAGITPIYQLAMGLLNDPEERTKVTVVWGTNTESDVFFRDEFDELAAKLPMRFKAHYTISRPSQDSRYRAGRVTKEFLQEVLEKDGFDVQQGGMVFLCGPPAMEEAVAGKKTGVLSSMGIGKDKLHRF